MHAPNLITVDDPSDPRLADYRDLKDRPLARDAGKLVAESEMVVKKLLESGLTVCSLLVTPPRLASLRPSLRPDVPVYVAAPSLLEAVAGFHVHRGCLAVALRPVEPAIPDDARLLCVLEDLVDVDNLGAMIRNAAGFGADAVVLSPRCADPYYRKAIRTSAGHVFGMPIVRLRRWPDELRILGERFTLLGAALGKGATQLSAVRRPPRVAVVLGSEGPGLSPEAKQACAELVQIPMGPGADSLNVAVAGAVILYHLTQVAPNALGR